MADAAGVAEGLTKARAFSKREMRDYDRGMLRSSWTSLFWCVLASRCDEPHNGRKVIPPLAKALGKRERAVMGWFERSDRNFSSDEIADILGALDVELIIQVRDRATGKIFTPCGEATETASLLTRQSKTESASTEGAG